MGRNGRRIIETQQFTVHDDRCAMKVGTDALLLGAWTELNGAQSIVDIGTGSGILLLMLAQRADKGTRLIGVELQSDAFEQACNNLEASPFHGEMEQGDALAWLDASAGRGERFDLLVCNPPFFRDKPLGPDQARNLARHDASMPIEKLLTSAERVLNDGGRLCLVWPDDRMPELSQAAHQAKLRISEDCQIHGHPEARPLRHLLVLRPWHTSAVQPPTQSTLIIEDGPRMPGKPPRYSRAYRSLLAPYFPGLSA